MSKGRDECMDLVSCNTSRIPKTERTLPLPLHGLGFRVRELLGISLAAATNVVSTANLNLIFTSEAFPVIPPLRHPLSSHRFLGRSGQ